jgi:hypothetical protein
MNVMVVKPVDRRKGTELTIEELAVRMSSGSLTVGRDNHTLLMRGEKVKTDRLDEY